jgi:hypothetical protein
LGPRVRKGRRLRPDTFSGLFHSRNMDFKMWLTGIIIGSIVDAGFLHFLVSLLGLTEALMGWLA